MSLRRLHTDLDLTVKDLEELHERLADAVFLVNGNPEGIRAEIAAAEKHERELRDEMSRLVRSAYD